MRLFTAVCFEREIRSALADTAQRLRQRALGGNFTREENFHLTLSFIGETDRVEAAVQAVERTLSSSFALETAGLSAFHRPGGDICYLGLQRSRALMALQAQQDTYLRAAGFALDNRPFKAHLTLGREVRLPPDFTWEAFSADLPTLTIPVRRVSLMKSERTGGRLCYTEIAGKDLRK